MSMPGNETNRTSGLNQAVKRVTDALDALDAALEARLENDRRGGALTEQVHVFNIDRSRLASELDEARARAAVTRVEIEGEAQQPRPQRFAHVGVSAHR